MNPLLTLFVRREQTVQDTLNQLSKQKRDDLKKPLKVMFIGEDAYDAGGVKKVNSKMAEFFNLKNMNMSKILKKNPVFHEN